MTLQQVKYLMTIIREGSLGKAAKKLYVSQPSLSAIIREVEREYGLVIFRRNSKGVELTHEGQEFAVDLQFMLDQYEYIDEKYRNRAADDKRFCISSQHHICGESAFLELVLSMGGNYRFGYLECKTSDVMRHVESGLSDVGFLFYYQSVKSIMTQELRKRGLIFNHIAYDRPHIYVGGKHPLAGRREVLTADIEDLPFISYDMADTGAGIFTSVVRHSSARRRNFYVSDRATAYSILRVTDAFLTGAGYPSGDSANDDIVNIPIADAGTIEIGWIVQKSRMLSEIADEFIALTRRMYGS